MDDLDKLLDALRLRGDPEVDALMPELMDRLPEVNRALDGYRGNDQQPPHDLPAAFRGFVLRARSLPAWVEHPPLERAGAMFVSHGVSLAAFYGITSMLERHALRPLALTAHALDRRQYSSAGRRLAETVQLVVDVMAPRALSPRGGAIPVMLKLRVLRAAERLLLLEDGADDLGSLPNNQEDLLAAWLTLAYTPLVHLRTLGGQPTPEQAEDYLYLWRLVGEMTGLDPAALPPSVAAAEALWAAICRRSRGHSEEATELTRDLLATFTTLVPGRALDGAVHGLARYLSGDELCDQLGVPDSRWQLLADRGALLGRLFDTAQRRSQVVQGVVRTLGRRLLDQGETLLSRLPGQPTRFRIPGELRGAWTVPPLGPRANVAAAIPALVDGFRAAATSASLALREALVDVGVAVASADQDIDPFEIEVLYRMLISFADEGPISDRQPDASLDEEAIIDAEADELADRIAASVDRIEKEGPAAAAHRIGTTILRLGAPAEALAFGVAVAYAKSGIGKAERRVIEDIARNAGIAGDALAAIVEATREKVESALD